MLGGTLGTVLIAFTVLYFVSRARHGRNNAQGYQPQGQGRQPFYMVVDRILGRLGLGCITVLLIALAIIVIVTGFIFGWWDDTSPAELIEPAKTEIVVTNTPTPTPTLVVLSGCIADYQDEEYPMEVGDVFYFGGVYWVECLDDGKPSYTSFDPRATSTPMPEPTAMPTNTPLATSATPVAETVAQQLCLADKISTINEVDQAGYQRIEVSVGLDARQHFEWYPQANVDTVSILVQPGEAAILMGYGSIWQYGQNICSEYDLLTDVTTYAKSRQDWGHSGLIWDSLQSWIDGEPPVINLWGVDPSQYRPVFAEDDITHDLNADSGEVVYETGFVGRDGDANGRRIGNDEFAYLIEAYKPVDGIIIVPIGESIAGIEGANWKFTSTESALADAETKGLPIWVVQGGELVQKN